MKTGVAIHWFRQDLRLNDNPSLESASQYENIIPIYILDDINPGEFELGSASKWWLHNSLNKLNESLNGKLLVFRGDPCEILNSLVQEHKITYISWNRCYEPWRIARDKKIKSTFETKDIKIESFSGSLLWEPWSISKDDGTPYRVFTPFYKKGCLNAEEPRLPSGRVNLTNFYDKIKSSFSIDGLGLLPVSYTHLTLPTTDQV